MSNKKKHEARRGVEDLKRDLNPLITIDESSGESLFMIVDFSVPQWNHVRRIISKRLANRNITAVVYSGEPGPDRTVVEKKNILEMSDAPEAKFWEAYRTLEMVYRAVGGTVEIRNYDGKSMQEAAALMKMLGHARVWEGSECDQINL
jgi:hypothetical protein